MGLKNKLNHLVEFIFLTTATQFTIQYTPVVRSVEFENCIFEEMLMVMFAYFEEVFVVVLVSFDQDTPPAIHEESQGYMVFHYTFFQVLLSLAQHIRAGK